MKKIKLIWNSGIWPLTWEKGGRPSILLPMDYIDTSSKPILWLLQTTCSRLWRTFLRLTHSKWIFPFSCQKATESIIHLQWLTIMRLSTMESMSLARIWKLKDWPSYPKSSKIWPAFKTNPLFIHAFLAFFCFSSLWQFL